MFVFGLYLATGTAQKITVYQPDQMHTDLEKFRKALIGIHPGTYTHKSPEEFEKMVALTFPGLHHAAQHGTALGHLVLGDLVEYLPEGVTLVLDVQVYSQLCLPHQHQVADRA